MSSFKDCIKFSLDIKDKNIIFLDFFIKFIDGKVHKSYLAKLIQPTCPFCGFLNFKHNGHYLFNINYITADASHPIIRLKKQHVICNDCHKNSMVQSSLVDKYCYISNISKCKVLDALTEDRTMTSIAREHNLSVNTVQKVLENCSSKFYDDFSFR